MKFKYHKSYKGFYLLDGSKFKRPYKKLDEEKTLENLANTFPKIIQPYFKSKNTKTILLVYIYLYSLLIKPKVLYELFGHLILL